MIWDFLSNLNDCNIYTINLLFISFFLLRTIASPPGFSGWTVISRMTHPFASLLSALFIQSEVREESFNSLCGTNTENEVVLLVHYHKCLQSFTVFYQHLHDCTQVFATGLNFSPSIFYQDLVLDCISV